MKHATGDFVDGGIELVDASGHNGAEKGADHLAPKLRPRRCAQQMSRFEILHHIAGLQGSGLRHGARNEVDSNGVFVAGGDDEGEEELGEFANATDGVEVRFAEGADAHEGEEEGKKEGEDDGVVGD